MATVCQVCGDRGFEEALVYCDSCKIAAMHCYCLGITPVPFEEYITWFCEECDGSDSGSDSEEVDMTAKLSDILKKSDKKKKKKKKKKSKESSSHASPVKAAEDNGIQDAYNGESEEVFSSPTIIETVKETERRESLVNVNSDELNGLVRNESTVLEVGDGASVSEKVEKEKKEKKKRKSIDHTLPVLRVEDHGLPDATIVEPVEVSKKRQSSEELRNEATVLEVGDGASVSEKGEKEKKKKKKKKKKKRKSIDQALPAFPVEVHMLPDATSVEPVEVAKKRQSSEEVNGLVRNEATVLEAGDGASASEKGEKEKKKKRKSIDQSLPALPVDDHLLPDATIVETVEVSKKRQRSDELISLVRNEASVLEAGDGASASDKVEKEKKKKKKKKRKSIDHSLPDLPVEDHQLPDANNVEPVEVSDKRQRSEELNGLARNKASVLEAGDGASASDKGEKEKKKKKKKKRKSSDHSLPVLPVEDHQVPDATSVEPVEVSDKRQRSEELNGLVRNETTVLEAGDGATVLEKGEKEKKKKKGKSINHSLPVLLVDDHVLLDTTIVEPVEVSKKRKSSEELNSLVRNEVSVLEKSEKKKKKTNKEVKKKKKKEESSNNTLPVIPVEDHVLHATIKETTDESEGREGDNGKSHELSGLVKTAASSVSEARNSSTVPDHSSCTSKKRKLSSGNIRVTSANTQLDDAGDNSCKEAESYMPRTAMDFNSPALNIDRAQPILEPTWRGSISIKNRNICNIDGLVAHLSSLACYQVHEKASSLQGRLSAEMVPRLEIWPNSFLKNGGPMDDSIALYFFPSSESGSNHEAVFYSLVREMKKNDSAMKCVLDDAELILFTSYQLPMHCWTFHSKEYLWGAFKPRKTSRQ